MCLQVAVFSQDLQASGFLWACFLLAGLASQEEYLWQGYELPGMDTGEILSACPLSPKHTLL